MKEIELTQNKFALVDDEDYEIFNQWNWQYSNGYAIRFERHGSTRKTIYLHIEILKPSKGKFTDHRNGNRLDCRKENLRESSREENNRNRPMHHDNKIGYKGVKKCGGKYQASLYMQGYVHIGTFDTAKDAALAYDKKSKELFGEFANLNFPD